MPSNATPPLSDWLKRRKQFVVYCAIGASGAALDFALYWILVNVFHVHYLIANIFSTTAGITNSFILNILFNFKVRDRLAARAVSFYAVGLCGLALTELILWLWVEKFHWPNTWGKAVSLFVVVLVQYNLNRLIAFRRPLPEAKLPAE